MTTFKRGDRVQFEKNGVVTYGPDDDGRVQIEMQDQDGQRWSTWTNITHLTRLPDPLPTTVGSVVRDGAGEVWILCKASWPEPYWRHSSRLLRPGELPVDWTLVLDAGAQ